MICDNCGKREANVMYSENINGTKKQLHLCELCSQKLGIGKMNFTIPTNFSTLLGDFIDEFKTTEFMPLFENLKTINCEQCGATFEDILNSGKLGCGNCYTVFEDRLEPILKRIQGNVQHIGRIGKENNIKENKEKTKNANITVTKENKINQLQEELKKAIKEERYEDAAKIRDEIKKEEDKKKEG